MPTELLGKSRKELEAFVASLGEATYRGAQLYHALYAERRFDFGGMTNLPLTLRAQLARQAAATLPELSRRFASADGTVRYLLSLASGKGDGAGEGRKPAQIETVFMPSAGRQTLCISTQAGCAVDCRFCLTATLGLVRNLTAGEMLGQVLLALEDHRARLAPRTNVVLMGQGEPLANYDAVMTAIRILLDREGLGLSPRHVTLSTSGVVPGITRLAQEPVRPKLAISLNASSDEQRSRLMPINRKYSLGMLLDACRRYPLRSWERLTFEYVLLGGSNDSPEDARRVARLLSGLRAKVNVIPWNPGQLPFQPPTRESTEAFRDALVERGVPAFVRYSRGQEIMAACGQLALLEASPADFKATLRPSPAIVSPSPTRQGVASRRKPGRAPSGAGRGRAARWRPSSGRPRGRRGDS
jgi:23S rRNA (adenine2503-C2)-methyltransferase